MNETTFLDQLANQIIIDFQHKLNNIRIVLPNKRAKVFLLQCLKNKLTTTVFAPKIISIEDLVQDISGIRSIDSIELLFEFYDVYLKITPKDQQQSFELFSNWAKTLLQDFNEIDRYLIQPKKVFSYLKEIEALKRWDLVPVQKTSLIDNHLDFWNKLPLYYEIFYKHLLNKKSGYQGLIYREAYKKCKSFAEKLGDEIIVFAGFNALNQAEEKIVQHLLYTNQAKIYWDIDDTFLKDPFHDAGLFIRRFKQNWKSYSSQPFEWITNCFQDEKNIQIIGTPKSVGQAKIAGNIIEKLSINGANINKTALVLGDENLLIPILYGLPNTIESLNITMGYSGKNNPAQILITKLFKLHTNAINRNEKSYTLYYKDVLEVLNHPLVESYVKVSELISVINDNNFTFFSHDTLIRLYNEKYPNLNNTFFDLLFNKWNSNCDEVLKTLSLILLQIKEHLSNDVEEEKVSKTFVYAIYKVINKLISYQEKYGRIDSIETLQVIYKQILDLAEVSFEGEPLSGLQIMGVLESRVLDFENVIITSVNEGKFPSGKSQNSFIPFDVKRELELPTYKEKDAIYSYHFYHLLMRAKNIYLLYNTDNEGIDAGEKSRFLTQLEIEKQPKHTLTHEIYNAVLPKTAYEVMEIEKTEKVLERLKEIATIKGFSPSSLTSYIRNPMQFYFQRVLRINEADEVEESIAVNTLGTIIHEALEELYEPFVGVYLSEHHVDVMLSKIEEVTLRQFKLIYKEGEIKKGKNLLAFEVAKRNIYNFLNSEKKAIQDKDAIKVICLEAPLDVTIEHEDLPYPVKIAGKVDRIEERNGSIRIIDYKSGKVEQRNLRINDFDGLTANLKNEKVIQLLCYAMMFQNSEMFQNQDIQAGIISFKNMKEGFMPFGLGKGKNAITEINLETIEEFKIELVHLILEILNKEIPFKETL
ncbi:PD-(D/E)XK nuclease family protein [Flavobacterium sp. N2270]|uniref:PD-(D/E)XK nuclease family protein n=1 Tax=Flavobacterium sp. N2270 TaxID=2986831 RepID=UPI00222534E4|nr:PD-(D/E)XK nuclease family protein [Flavobacterium sp. N2270]